MKQAEQEGTSVVDVDGSYLYKKYRSLVDAGQQVSLPAYPSPPISGWKSVTDVTHQAIAPSIPAVISGGASNIILNPGNIYVVALLTVFLS